MRNFSFTLSDHLGNIRVVVDEQGQVQQKNEYGEDFYVKKQEFFQFLIEKFPDE